MTKYNTHTLANGLRVIHLPSESQVVYCGLQIAAGTRNERPGEEGLAHFCEHVTFKGTARRRAWHILNALESVGGELNAFTNKESTVYYAAILKEHLPRAVDLLTDIVLHSTYPQHELDKEQYQKNYEAQQRYIKKEEQFIAAHIVRATSAKAAKSHRARLAHLEVMDAPSKDEGNVHFNFPFTKDVGQKPLEVNELVIGYDKPLLSPISFLLKKGEKIAILGQNGVGKSTFIKTILGQIPSLGGSYKWLDGIELNYYGQDEKIDLEMSPFDYIHNIYPNLTNTEVRTLLGAVGVKKELALRKMKELSGGEMTKARLAVMTRKKSNFLVFDEPTNHLDQKAKDALFEAIENYPGAVIIVSHEKDFYDGLVDYELKF